MPSFDVVSEVDLQEVRNAVDQAEPRGSRPASTSRAPTARSSSRRTTDRARVRERGAAEGPHPGARGEAGQAQGVAEARSTTARSRRPRRGRVRQTVTLQRRHLRREGARDRQVHQGAGAQGRAAPGAGRSAAGERQEAGRPAEGDRGAEGERLRDPAPVHQLPGLTTAAALQVVVRTALRRGRRRGGCVKRLAKFTLRPVSGLMMYAVAWAGSTFIGTCLA